MSTSPPSIISIGCQAGGPEAAFIGELKVSLYRALSKHVTSTHCSAIDEYAVVLRVDGTLDKFGEEGLAHLRFAKAHRYITVDIQIPETVWQPMSTQQLKAYLALQVKNGIFACASRLIKEKYAVAAQELQSQIDAATNEYLAVENAD